MFVDTGKLLETLRKTPLMKVEKFIKDYFLRDIAKLNQFGNKIKHIKFAKDLKG